MVVPRADAVAAWQTEVGYDKLVAALGSDVPDGNGVAVSLVEAAQINSGESLNYQWHPFMPNPADPEFAANDPYSQPVTFVDVNSKGPAYQRDSNGAFVIVEGQMVPLYSGHATGTVGWWFVGNQSGLAKGANSVDVYEANDYLSSVVKYSGSQNPTPQNYRVQNFSWVGSFATSAGFPANLTISDPNNLSALRRFDYLADTANGGEGMVPVVGLYNGTGTGIPYLWGHSYNAIVAGRTDGQHSTGLTLTASSNSYGPGRSKPDLVAPASVTSTATAQISSAATILYDTMLAGPVAGHNAEVVKAIMLAGAEKKASFNWHPLGSTMLPSGAINVTQPLDDTFGAGELDVWNNYLIATGGQTAGSQTQPAGAASNNGWDYQDLKSDSGAGPMYYTLEIPAGTVAQELSIVLNWNVKVTDTLPAANQFSPTHSLQNLDLKLYDSTAGFLDTLVAQSVSTVDNVEHLYFSNIDGSATNDLAAGTYTIEVSGAAGWDYGLAWRMSTLFENPSADFDDNGVVDANDFLVWQRNNGKLQGALHGEGDADGDGDVDPADLAYLQSVYGSSTAPPPQDVLLLAAAVPEPSTLVLTAGLTASVVLLTMRRRRQSARTAG